MSPSDLWPTYGKLAVRWIESALIHGEGDHYGKPFRLLEEQKPAVPDFGERPNLAPPRLSKP